MSLWQEFKQFAIKGNVIDLAVGVIIGAAFGKISTSLVEDVIMPPLGIILGKVNFSDMLIVLPGQEAKIQAAGKALKTAADYKAAGVSAISYGQFLNNVVQFVIIAFAVFLLVKAINHLKAVTEKEAEPGEPITKDCPYCLQTIPAKATRCPHCTSELPTDVVESN